MLEVHPGFALHLAQWKRLLLPLLLRLVMLFRLDQQIPGKPAFKRTLAPQ
uniref:Uncharacterized protein n=2 Tax=Picea TaxID=3328 RepID=A0A101M5I1_PICGL|nr:hypothetical protein ABT39_MTgene1217 [Picea glauca]QHR92867.1 hypothetical protein Q903MT_gene6915 [Picea sitchensis]